jgi:2-oxoisovalerate dehydrogenase E1 component alpha subunit
MKTIRVDGNDYYAVHAVTQEAREWCLRGKGPVLIEAMTYRLGAHSTSDDPSAYRDDAEVAEWQEKCPILRLRRHLEQRKLWDEMKEKVFAAEVKGQIDAAISVARKEPPPDPHSMIEDVYFEVPQILEDQLAEVKRCQS